MHLRPILCFCFAAKCYILTLYLIQPLCSAKSLHIIPQQLTLAEPFKAHLSLRGTDLVQFSMTDHSVCVMQLELMSHVKGLRCSFQKCQGSNPLREVLSLMLT